MDDRKYDALKIENQLCFPLYACARETIKLYTPLLDTLDLTYTQYIAMLVLWEEQSVTVKRLGERLYLDSGTLTPLLKKLEAKGLVSRRRSVEDAVSIPAKMAKCVRLEPEEALTLYRLLYKMLEASE